MLEQVPLLGRTTDTSPRDVGPTLPTCTTVVSKGAWDPIDTLAFDGSALYFRGHVVDHPADRFAIVRLALDGTTTTIVGDAAVAVSSLATDDTNVFYVRDNGTSDAGIFSATKGGASAGSPKRVTPSGTSTNFDTLAVDATRVYWWDGDSLFWIPKGGGTVDGAPFTVSDRAGFAVDSTAAYWVSRSDGIIHAVNRTSLAATTVGK